MMRFKHKKAWCVSVMNIYDGQVSHMIYHDKETARKIHAIYLGEKTYGNVTIKKIKAPR